ncbi:M15 family metallopeptidase [Flammeovirga agarivorans]|uniref:D-alanyl-D-alanine dipeptidase n=1 Tax=Flammeovirga agarivorans TaxID=2726742 RepID=A0A7X8XYF6_9BACT|nr:M15 family metallopeptidase [Flammeovirga agarivorans]NLR94172.1 M15 family metallopeptidase [Flammeovirga agarivorans]
MFRYLLLLFVFGIFSCSTSSSSEINLVKTETLQAPTLNKSIDNIIHAIVDKKLAQSKYLKEIQPWPDSSFVELDRLDSLFVLDIRYATTNNFTKTVLYDCPKAMLRKVVALQLVKVQQELIKKGYRIKLFDCYRPLSVQWKMWKVYPDRRYVADPRIGSWHNRGLAVDLTLCDLDGNQIEMGTPYDYFGKEAWPAYENLSKDVLHHRKLLAKTMWKYGFGPTSTEWWHYSYQSVRFGVSNFPFSCQKN